VAFRGTEVLARFELGHPIVGFFGGRVQSGRLTMIPRRERVLPQWFTLLFAFEYRSMASHIPQCAERRRTEASRCTRSFVFASSFRLVVEGDALVSTPTVLPRIITPTALWKHPSTPV
jgi:hypothetical protein